MHSRKLFHTVRPLLSALAVIATAGFLVFAIYFTELGPQWITFLTGILVAAILAEATRRSRAEWVVTRRTAQLSAIKIKLERESQLRKIAEQAVAAGKSKLHLIDEILPTMVAFIDREGCCQYHNRAFLGWSRLRPEQINGRHLRDVLGAKDYQEIASSLRQSLEGREVHYERTQKMPDGQTRRLAVEHLPQFAENDKVTGFYMLINGITSQDDAPIAQSSVDQNMFVDTYSEHITGHHDANMIKMAIEKGEFSLFCQQITPLTSSGEAAHYEILVRLIEEEEGMMPPGMFFPLAEKHGLMPHLDRWVVQHVTKWIASQKFTAAQNQSMYFINISGATISDSSFPEFLRLTLLEYGVSGSTLCFEISDSELALRTADVAKFARQVRQDGCRVALSGFGRDRVLFDLIRGFQVEFLKLDGSVILNILSDPAKLAKVTAISQVAKKIGVHTIAEMVENEETITSLRKIGIDFAQGFGISKPRPLAE